MKSPSQEAGYFDALYDGDPDPWGFESRPYERAKYDATLAALPAQRYRSALEVGCANGVLTERLAGRCDALLGMDIVEKALLRAQQRCGHLENVRFARSELPDEPPSGPFDLVVLSEVLYYFDEGELARLAQRLVPQLAGDATLLLVHWLGPTPDYPLSGDAATRCFQHAMSGWEPMRQDRTPDYRIDLLRVRTVE